MTAEQAKQLALSAVRETVDDFCKEIENAIKLVASKGSRSATFIIDRLNKQDILQVKEKFIANGFIVEQLVGVYLRISW